jgi:hypothetical protein
MDFDPQPITNWFALILAVGGTVTLLTGVVVRVNKRFEKRVSDLITEATKQIQPASNGGLSLTDLHGKFDAMDTKVDRLERHYDAVIDMEEKAREVWHARYEEDQKRIKKEWTAFFVAIRKMMHLPVAEQIKVWDGITQAFVDGTITEQYPDERKNDG